MNDGWGPGYPHTRAWQSDQWDVRSNVRRGDTAEAHKLLAVVERRQDMTVAGVTCCEHAFTWARVARDLASYKLGCLHFDLHPCRSEFSNHILFHYPSSGLSVLPLSSHM